MDGTQLSVWSAGVRQCSVCLPLQMRGGQISVSMAALWEGEAVTDREFNP